MTPHLFCCHGFTYYVYLLLLLCFVQFAAAQSPDPPNDDAKTIILASFISSMAFWGFLTFYRCLRDIFAGDGINIQPEVIASAPSKRASGLDLAVVENFPTFIYSSVVRAAYSAECPVCLSEFEDDDTLRLLPKCNHVFHLECIDAWLAAHTTCPVCRSDLIPESGQVAVVSVDIPDSSVGESDEVSGRSNMGDEQNQVSVRVNEDQSKELPASDIPMQSRPTRSQFVAGKLPPSQSTSHSDVQPRDNNYERYTLRLAEDV